MSLPTLVMVGSLATTALGTPEVCGLRDRNVASPEGCFIEESADCWHRRSSFAYLGPIPRHPRRNERQFDPGSAYGAGRLPRNIAPVWDRHAL